MEAVKKQNVGFIMRPYSFFQSKNGHKPTSIETVVKGVAYSFGRGDNVARFGYSTFKEKLNVSRSSAARKVALMKNDPLFKVTRKGGACTEYEYTGDKDACGHIRSEYFFFTTKFKIYGTERVLTNAEIDVLSLIYTHTLSKQGYYEGSMRAISETINISEKTVLRSIFALFNADLISRPVRGVNGREMSRFCANLKLLRKTKRAEQKKAKAAIVQEKPLPKAILDVNAQTDFKAYYERLRERAQLLALHNEEKANKIPRFVDVSKRLRIIEIETARAERENDLQRGQALRDEKTRLNAARAAILSKIGLTVDELEAKHFYKCKKCFDTGHVPGGAQCDCWKAGGAL